MMMREEFSRYYFVIRDKIKTRQTTVCKHSLYQRHNHLDLIDQTVYCFKRLGLFPVGSSKMTGLLLSIMLEVV